ncbi:putative ribonuclease H-like domain-containing protein [Tanacetum coccineum]
MPLWKDGSLFDSSSKNASNDEPQPSSNAGKNINTASTNITTGSLNINTISPTITTAKSNGSQTEPNMFSLGDNVTLEATHVDFFGDKTEVDMSNITTTYPGPSTPNIRIHKDHSLDYVIRDVHTSRAPKGNPSITRSKLDRSYARRASAVQITIDERGIVIRNKVRLVAQGYTQEERIDYDEVFAPVDRIEAIRLFLAYTSFKDFVVYQIDVKSAFLYARLKRKFMFVNLQDLKIQNSLTEFIRSTKKELCTEFEKLMHKKFQMSSIGKLTFFLGLQVSRKDDGIFISQDKYVDEILKKFGFSTMKTASTPMENLKPLLKDTKAEDVDVHLYRLMIGSLMYLTASRPDIIFAVCACIRFQVTPKVSHLYVVKRIFRYLKVQPKLGLWYPKDSPFDLEAYNDSDYAGTSLDRKSTTGGCQFLRRRLISWQCKKQTIFANSTTEAEYVAASSCCGHVLWIQNQMLDYGYNFMNTKIFIDNESTICIVKNPAFHSKTKHIDIIHHFIRDSNEKKLIQMIKIYTYQNVIDLLTKAFDVSIFQYLIASIGMLNL